MDIAITGSSGLIGAALTASLTGDGHNVLRVVRRAPNGSDEVRWDPAAGTIDAPGLEGLDAVVHLAGESIGGGRWSEAKKAAIRDSRIAGTTLLAETLAKSDRPPSVLVSGSAIGYYGDRGDQVLTEASTPAQDFLARICVDWEAATAAAETAGIRVAHARTGIVLDRAEGALARMLPLFKLGLGGRLGNGRQYWSWISLADEVAALRYLIEHPLSGPVNLTAPNPATNAEFTKSLARALKRPALVPVPAFGPKLVLGGELAEALLFASARVQPAVLSEAGYSFHHPTLDAALTAVLSR
jgi:hypothetical protein